VQNSERVSSNILVLYRKISNLIKSGNILNSGQIWSIEWGMESLDRKVSSHPQQVFYWNPTLEKQRSYCRIVVPRSTGAALRDHSRLKVLPDDKLSRFKVLSSFSIMVSLNLSVSITVAGWVLCTLSVAGSFNKPWIPQQVGTIGQIVKIAIVCAEI